MYFMAFITAVYIAEIDNENLRHAKMFKQTYIKKYMSDQSVLLSKWFTHGGMTLAKGQIGHLYTF